MHLQLALEPGKAPVQRFELVPGEVGQLPFRCRVVAQRDEICLLGGRLVQRANGRHDRIELGEFP